MPVDAERLDRAGGVGELGEGRRRIFRIEPGLLEQVLVVHPHGQVDDEGQAVLLAFPGRRDDVRLADVVDARQSVDAVGDVHEQALRRPVRHEHDVGREQVRQLVGGRRVAHDPDVLVRRNEAQLDLVLVRRVVGIDLRLDAGLRRCAAPHRDGRAVVDALLRDRAAGRRWRARAEPTGPRPGPPAGGAADGARCGAAAARGDQQDSSDREGGQPESVPHPVLLLLPNRPGLSRHQMRLRPLPGARRLRYHHANRVQYIRFARLR